MRDLLTRTAITMAFVLLVPTACGANGVPTATSGSPVSLVRIGDDAAARNLSGQYAGKVKDNDYGSARAIASLAQYKSSLGGPESIRFSTGSVTNSVVLNLSGTALNGTTVSSVKNVVCSFSTTATYDAKTHLLSGSYKAINRCSGEKGTYSLKHQCLFKSAENDDVRPETGLKPC